MHEHRLRNLQLEALCRQPGFRHRADDHERQSAVPELRRRNIDRDAHGARPFRRIETCLLEHPLSDAVDQPGLLRYRNELGGQHHPSLRMPPPEQCLAAGHHSGFEIENGLVVKDELAF